MGKKYNERNLRYMRQFYELIENTKWNTMCSKLSWNHYREIISLENKQEIIFYLKEPENKNLKKEFQDNTIGIIICKKENKIIIEYCSDKRIGVREYELL